MTRDRVLLMVLVAGFGWGTATHAADFVRHGWWPYRFGPLALNLFWNALVFLDAAVVALLVSGRRRAGLALGAAVMAVDVAVNSYAWRGLGIGDFATAVPVQAAFAGFLFGALGLLWPLQR